ncbi:DUF397 domain-containing protein [Streptomyces sp. NPDC017940]|uniref:DUF397 domain-containing protein n=1 Tax=Streptomyces sp. NPDC017940 TaxID=3365017 RepID=UPI0037919CAD
MPEFKFAKSSHSQVNGECVEVAINVPGTVAVRDSKGTHPVAPVVHLTPAAWLNFTASLR